MPDRDIGQKWLHLATDKGLKVFRLTDWSGILRANMLIFNFDVFPNGAFSAEEFWIPVLHNSVDRFGDS